jgi:hypothetical protein
MKTTTSLLSCLALGGLLLAAAPADAAAKFYKWTDEQGATHYSEDPPPSTVKGASEVKVRTRLPYSSEEKAAAPQAGKETASAKKDDKKDDKSKGKKEEAPKAPPAPEQYAEKCKKLNSDLQTMQEHERVKVTDASGEPRVLTSDEKSARQDSIQREIKAFCQ